MRKNYLGVLLIILSSFGFGIMPIFALSAYKSNITVPTLLFLRFLMASILFFAYVFIKKYRLNYGWKGTFSLFILGGVCYTLQSTLYFTAVKYIPASLAVMILYTSPVIIAIMSYFIDHEKITIKTAISALLSLFGIFLINKGEPGNLNILGILMAVGATLVYACYIVLSNKVVKQIQPVVSSAYVTFFTSLSLLASGLVTESIRFDFSASVWSPLLGLVLLSTVLSIFTLFGGLEILGSTRSSILGMMEPVFTVILSVIFLHEIITPVKGFGGVLILSSAALVILSQNKVKAESQEKTDEIKEIS